MANMVKLDRLDEQIMRVLGRNASQPSAMIAREINASSSTVRRRIRMLVERRILRIAGLVDPIKAGFPLAAVIAFNVAHEKLEQVAGALASHPEVKWVTVTTGRFDILAWACFASTDELAGFVRLKAGRLDGVKSTETFICLHVDKGGYVVWGDSGAGGLG